MATVGVKGLTWSDWKSWRCATRSSWTWICISSRD